MAGFDKNAISVIKPDHKQYDDFDVSADGSYSRHRSTSFYNDLMRAYNQCEVGEILIVPLPPDIKYFNLKNILKGRGLINKQDVVIARQEIAPDGTPLPRSDRPAKLKKLTETEGRVIDNCPKQPQDTGS